MIDNKITPDAVKKIESALEERKTKRDRRQGDSEPNDSDRRRTGRDRRTPGK